MKFIFCLILGLSLTSQSQIRIASKGFNMNESDLRIIFKSAVNLKFYTSKVEKILKGSLNLISSHSPSVKIQIMGSKGKTLLDIVNKLLYSKVC